MSNLVHSVVKGTNATLIAEVARLWIKPEDKVIDLTYGRGNWWKKFRPQLLLTNDLFCDADWHEDYRALPHFLDNTFEVVAFDPPYISTGPGEKSTILSQYGSRGQFLERYGLRDSNRGWQALFADIGFGVQGTARILAPGGHALIKCCDYVESGKRRWARRHIVETAYDAGLEQVDEFIHHSGTGPQPARPRQVHSRRAHSFLLVFEKPKR